MKKNNYFAIHKNKKPKRKLEKYNIPHFMAAINKAIVRALEVTQSLSEMKQSKKRITSRMSVFLLLVTYKSIVCLN